MRAPDVRCREFLVCSAVLRLCPRCEWNVQPRLLLLGRAMFPPTATLFKEARASDVVSTARLSSLAARDDAMTTSHAFPLEPTSIHVSDEALDDLRTRLSLHTAEARIRAFKASRVAPSSARAGAPPQPARSPVSAGSSRR